MCSASICLWFPFFRPPQILPRSKESLTLVFLELFSTGCPIGFTQVGVESWISFDIEAVKWNLICVQWALYAPISNLVDFISLNFVQRFKSRSSQSSWHCQHKSFQSKFWTCKSHKLNTLRQRIATSSTKLFSTPGPPERLLGPGLAAWASEDGHWLAWAQFNNSLVSSGNEICVYFRRSKF